MRNQTWDKGKLVEDIELYLDNDTLKAKDWLTGKTRNATPWEIAIFLDTIRADAEAERRRRLEQLPGELDELKHRVEDLEKVSVSPGKT